jgi:hypothetical protein
MAINELLAHGNKRDLEQLKAQFLNAEDNKLADEDRRGQSGEIPS